MKEINIGRVLIKNRHKRGITQDELANHLGVSKGAVSKWETGSSLPDILLLPQLASYFDISIDELIGYQPQMEQEDIKELYIRLSKDFSVLSFDEVLAECLKIAKKFYACYPLLFELGTLLINHTSQASSPEQVEQIMEKALEWFHRVRTEADETNLQKESLLMEAFCLLQLQRPSEVRFDENEMMPFKSIMNEYYARDTSKKIRSVKKTTALSGGFCGSFAPYGYVVDPENKRKLLVDPDTAPIVKRIFELSKQGNSVHQIARTLCEDDVLIPRAYRAMKKGTLETSTGFKFPTDWVAKNVKMILENQVYLGHMVSHKTQTKSFKNKKPVAVPKEEWIIVRNTHEAIIDEETFELVQKFISVKKQPNKTGRPNIFVGLVKCPDCGRNMAFSNPNGREPRFRCRTYVRNSNLCTTHAISYEALQQIVMSDIQKHIKNMEALGDQFIQEMHELSEKGGSKKIKQFEKDLEVAEKRIAEIDSVIMKLFEQNALGKISDERFEKMSSAYESEQKELAQKRDELRTKIRAEEKKTQSTNQFLETIRKYETVTELNRSMLVELIDSIYVYQAEGTGKDRKQRVEINYRFLAGSQCGIA